MEKEVHSGDIIEITMPYDIKLPFPWGRCRGRVKIYVYLADIGYETARVIISGPDEVGE